MGINRKIKVILYLVTAVVVVAFGILRINHSTQWLGLKTTEFLRGIAVEVSLALIVLWLLYVVSLALLQKRGKITATKE